MTIDETHTRMVEELRGEDPHHLTVVEPVAGDSPAVTLKGEVETIAPPPTLILDLIERIRNL